MFPMASDTRGAILSHMAQASSELRDATRLLLGVLRQDQADPPPPTRPTPCPLRHLQSVPLMAQPCGFVLGQPVLIAQSIRVCNEVSRHQAWFSTAEYNMWACERHQTQAFSLMVDRALNTMDFPIVQTFIVIQV